MQTNRNAALKQAALIPVAGNFDRKPRPLDRDVTTIGRARGTDLCLEAHEISTLHCVVFRTGESYRIRDCNSRCGTRVNGESVKNAPLRDGDIVNLGPFSFEFRLPPSLFPKDASRPDPVLIEHWQESRRRLAQHAMRLRQRLRDPAMHVREQEWTQKAHLLKEKIRSYDQRFGELEAAEEELADDRRKLERENEKMLQRMQGVENELAERYAQLEKDIHERWREFQQRCRNEEARVGAEPPEKVANTKETLHDGAAQRQKEAAERNKHLQELEEHVTRRHEKWQRELGEFNAMKEQWVRDQSSASATLEQQQATLAQQRAELMRMMGDLKRMQEDLRKQAKTDVHALSEEVELLRRDNAELRERLDAAGESVPASASADDETQRQLDDLRAEIALLQEELQVRDQTLDELQKSPAAKPDAENQILRKLLDEKEKLLQEQADKISQRPPSASDLERYETELNAFRQQLEDDRTKLNLEVETLRERNKELDEAIREMEMEMSKERAELARERMRLERVREEVKIDMERLQREQSVRDSMAPVQKLRDELAQKQPGNDRMRTLREAPTASS